jgi:hypothetical protein
MYNKVAGFDAGKVLAGLTSAGPEVLALLPILSRISDLALARIGGSLPLEVPIDGAVLHEIAPRSAYRADNNFLVLEGGCEGKIMLFCKNLE